jgi:hypothetical protein
MALEDKYAPTYRGEDNRNRRFRNTVEYCKEIHCHHYSFALTLSPHRAVLQAEYKIWTHNKNNSITFTLNG